MYSAVIVSYYRALMLGIYRRRGMRGRGIGDVFKRLYQTIRDKKLISKGLSMAAPYSGSYSPIVSGASALASKLGFGRRRMYRQKARGLRLAGGRRMRRRYY